MSSSMTTVGRFRDAYRALTRAKQANGAPLLDVTPVILAEGDSWFSTPLYPNLMDGVASRVRGLFLRIEKPGDTARNIFGKANLKRLADHLRTFRFDAVALSAGGNDVVDEFLKKTFKGAKNLTVTAALDRVIDTKIFDKLHKGYQDFVDLAGDVSPTTAIIAHTYAYPRLLGAPAQLRAQQIGLIALFKHSVGDWIDKHIDQALPAPADRLSFVHGLIDAFEARVLDRVAGSNFHVLDLRAEIQADELWNDEMHPTASGFDQLAARMTARIAVVLPPAKRGAVTA